MTSASVTTHSCTLILAGMVPYIEGWAWQRRLAAERSTGIGSDTLLVLEHPPTITLGTRANPAHVLADARTLEQCGVALVPVDRGGDVTYHGPGQIVGYPVLKLGPLGIGVVDYVRRLEETLIRTLACYDVSGERVPGLSGVWVQGGAAKIAAVGVKVSAAGVTTHGFALNYAPDMSHFALVTPCGIADRAVISLEQLLERLPARDELVQRLVATFADVFDLELVPGAA